MLKLLGQSVLDAFISKTIQGTRLIFGMEITLNAGLVLGWGQRSIFRMMLWLKFILFEGMNVQQINK